MNQLNPIDAYNAINKFLYYSWNYRLTRIAYDGREVHVPTFLPEVKWNSPYSHMVQKWQMAVVKNDNPMVELWADLDTENRMALVEWIINNYNSEPGKAK